MSSQVLSITYARWSETIMPAAKGACEVSLVFIFILIPPCMYCSFRERVTPHISTRPLSTLRCESLHPPQNGMHPNYGRRALSPYLAGVLHQLSLYYACGAALHLLHCFLLLVSKRGGDIAVERRGGLPLPLGSRSPPFICSIRRIHAGKNLLEDRT